MSSKQFDMKPPAADIQPPAPFVPSHADAASIRSRIAKAEKDRDNWKVSGSQEKYLEAYFLVEALELQLDERLRIARALRSAGS